MKKIIFIAAAVLLAAFAVIKLINNREKNVVQSENLNVDEVSVSVKDVVKQKASFNLNFTGTLYPIKELDIPAETSGRITSLNFELGQYFNKGSVIAVIDNELKQIAYDNARIEAEKLENDYKRIQNLYSGGTSSKQDLDDAKYSYETAKNKLDDAAKQLSQTKVTTSISGTISEKNVEEGSYVNSGSVIAIIVDITRFKVKMNASEANVYYLRKGDKVKVTTDVYPNTEFTGTVTFISPDGDESHNFPVEVEIANSSKYPLKSGTFVNVEAAVGVDKTSLFIPRIALLGSIKDAKVYIASNGKAALKKIAIGIEKGDMLEVTDGLTGDEKIIVSGQVNLTDNNPIKIINN